jgi:hypothetical protein
MKSMQIISNAKVAMIPGGVPSLSDLGDVLHVGIRANMSSLPLKYSKLKRDAIWSFIG